MKREMNLQQPTIGFASQVAGAPGASCSSMSSDKPSNPPTVATKVRTALGLGIRFIVCGLLFLTVIAFLVPFSPTMPASGLDGSWVFSMSQGISQGLAFGERIVFTYGPFASIGTKAYHPATNRMTMFGSLFVAICYGTALLLFASRGRLLWMLIFAAYLASFVYLNDAIFLSYPLILAGLVFRVTRSDSRLRELPNLRLSAPLWVLLFSVLGLLPLVKTSFVVVCALTSLLCIVEFLRYRLKTLAYCCILSPVIGGVVFWLTAGQPLLALPVYAWRTIPVLSGYSEAMAMAVDGRQVALYLVASAVVLWMVATVAETATFDRSFLVGSFGLYLFLAFKSGFVRHGGHALTAGSAIVVAALLGAFIPGVRNAGNVLVLAVLSWALIDGAFISSSTRSFYKNVTATYRNTVNGLRIRVSHPQELQAAFNQRMGAIAADAHIPPLQGTADIYSAQQIDLIASGNHWNPRPIIQSYVAYTASLAKLNEAHLYGTGAPDHLLFRIEPIDGRLPSLEDGISWFAMMQNYVPVKRLDRFVYLDKRVSGQGNVSLDPLTTVTGEVGKTLALPNSSRPLFAELEIRPTLLGRLIAFLYKPSQLKIALELQNGEKREYRIISDMAKSAFLISPLVDSNETFAMLQGDKTAPVERLVKAIDITPVDNPSLLWGSNYELRLFALNETGPDLAKPGLFDKVEDLVAMETTSPVTVTCDVGMQEVNGSPVRPAGMESRRLLMADGWLAVSARGGIGPEDIYVTLTDEQGRTIFLKTQRSARADVKVYLKHPEMSDLGFEMVADVSSLKGDYQFGMGRKYNGQFGRCSTPNIPILMTGGSPQGNYPVYTP